MTRWVVAVNPAAGRRPVAVGRVRGALAGAGIDAEVVVADGVDSMRRIVAEAAGEERLAVVGGDGTMNLAINTLLGTEQRRLPVLALLPAGTGCDLLRTFAIPSRIEEASHHLRGDRVYTIDIGELEGSWGVRRFANVAEAGVGAAAVATAARMPRRLGSTRYMTAFGLRLPGFPGGQVALTTDRRSHTGPALAVIFANGQFFGGGWNIAPKAMLVDGAFDIQVIDVPKTAAAALVPKLKRGLHLTEPGVRRISAASFRLETEHPWPVEADGELLGNTPVEGRVLPAAITLKI